MIIKMSSRLGMADGRCFTVSVSSRILNEEIAYKSGIDVRDNYAYRQSLQATPEKYVEMLTPKDCLPIVNSEF